MRGIAVARSPARLGSPSAVVRRMAAAGLAADATAHWSDASCALAASGASRLVVLVDAHAARLVLAWDGRLDEVAPLRQALHAGGAPIPDARVVTAGSSCTASLDTRSRDPRADAAHGIDARDAVLAATALARWGEAGLKRLVGDFALAAWDPSEQRLVVARDPMGMRPMYLWETGTAVLVASEARQLLASGGPSGEIDERMAAAHLAGPYGRSNWTYHRGVAAVRPGEVVVRGDPERSATHFASLAPDAPLSTSDPRAYDEAFRAAFLDAVSVRTVGPGRVGLLLSGGLDSGAVASSVGWLREQGKHIAPGGFTGYRWAFLDPALAHDDEREASRDVVERYGLAVCDVPGDDAWPLAPDVTPEPHPDSPFQRVYAGLDARTRARARLDGATHLLTADRGDEVVGDWVFDLFGMVRAGNLGRWPAELRAVARLQGTTLLGALRQHLFGPLLRAGPFPRAWTVTGRRSQGRVAMPPYVRPGFARSSGLRTTMAERPVPPDGLSEASARRWERISYARGLRDPVVTEREAARDGLRWADPWSDVRLARLILAMPAWRVQQPSAPKDLPRRALRGIVPDRMTGRLDKHRPAALYDRAFRERAVGQVLDLFTGSQLEARGWADETWLREAALDYARAGTFRADLWWPISLERWLRRHHA